MTLKDRMARAEDYVFGLMDEHERERAERDMEVDAEFRDCVMVLAERLRRLREPHGPISISDDAWNEISDRIATMPQMTAGDAAARLAAMGVQAPDPSRKGLLRVKRPFAHHFDGWRGTVIAGALAAAMAVGYFAGQGTAPAPSPLTVAVLETGDGTPGAVIEAYPADRLRFLPLVDFDVPTGKVLQLWLGEMPVAVLDRAADVTLQGPDGSAPQVGGRYEITLEDAPASSTGRPQGPVLARGVAVAPPR